MKTFAIAPTPASARQIVRLSEVMPNILVTPDIAALASTGLVTDEHDIPADFVDEEIRLAQDLLDFNLRAIVILPVASGKSGQGWLRAALYAARSRQVRDIVVPDTTSARVSEICQQAEAAGFRSHVCSNGILDGNDPVPRDALLLLPVGAKSRYDEMHPLQMEFERTIIFGDALNCNKAKVNPRMPSMICSEINERETRARLALPKYLSEQNPRKIAFLFSTTYAVSQSQNPIDELRVAINLRQSNSQ